MIRRLSLTVAAAAILVTGSAQVEPLPAQVGPTVGCTTFCAVTALAITAALKNPVAGLAYLGGCIVGCSA